MTSLDASPFEGANLVHGLKERVPETLDGSAHSAAEVDRPFVTVVMPVRNESAYIDRSVAAVLAQDYPEDRMEILVADGMSTDGTEERVRALGLRHLRLRLLENPSRIVATGLNLALAQAKGNVVIRVDGHCEIPPDYVTRCVLHLERGDAEGVGGWVETVGETTQARAIALAMSSSFGVGGSAFRTVTDKTMLVDTVPFPAYRRSVIDRLGPFDEELVRNQDDEYNYRLRKAGGRILLAPDVWSRYYSRGSLWSLWRQYFQYGYWKVRVMQKHRRQMKARQFVPALFVGFMTFLTAAALFWGWAGRAWGVAAGFYLVACLGASALAIRGQSRKLLPLLPVAFATLHCAYGAGFWLGLIRFWHRWGGQRDRAALRNSTEIG